MSNKELWITEDGTWGTNPPAVFDFSAWDNLHYTDSMDYVAEYLRKEWAAYIIDKPHEPTGQWHCETCETLVRAFRNSN